MAYVSFTTRNDIYKEVFPWEVTTAFEAEMRREERKIRGPIRVEPKELTKEELLKYNKGSTLEL